MRAIYDRLIRTTSAYGCHARSVRSSAAEIHGQCSAGYDALFVGVTYRRRPPQAPSHQGDQSAGPQARRCGARAHTHMGIWDSLRSSGRGGGAQHRTAEQRESARRVACATGPAGAPGDDKRVAPPQL